MTVLLLGALGQLGRTIRARLESEHRVVPLGHAELDLTRDTDVVATVRDVKPGIIINCAAYTTWMAPRMTRSQHSR